MIWIDVDGVLADFLGYVEDVAKVKFDLPFDYKQLNAEVARLGGPVDWSWERQVRWNEIRPFPWARDLVAGCQRLGRVGIITACIHEDRKFWLDWMFPLVPKVFTEHKVIVMGEWDVVIDDYPYPVDRLIRFPARWWTSEEPNITNILEQVNAYRSS